MTIEENMNKVLEALGEAKRDEMGDAWMSGLKLKEATGLSPAEINDAVQNLANRGLVESHGAMGTAPYKFARINITSEGRLALEKQ